jgi:hypothetical protein
VRRAANSATWTDRRNELLAAEPSPLAALPFTAALIAAARFSAIPQQKIENLRYNPTANKAWVECRHLDGRPAMRLMIVVFVLTLLVIIDQFRFRGHYTSEVSRFVTTVVRSFI